MNPPFGDASLPSKPYLDDTYGDTKGDVYKAFVECFQARLIPVGYLGIISSRTGFFLGQSEDWRTRVVLRLFRPIVLADLGMGVLDAMVEVAAYVLRGLSESEARDLTLSLVPVLNHVALDRQGRFSLPKWQAARDGLKRHQLVAELEQLEAAGFVRRSPGDIIRYTPLWRAVKAAPAPPEPIFPPLVCIRALAEENKGGAILALLRDAIGGGVFVSNPGDFAAIPSSPFAYWASTKLLTLAQRFPAYEPAVGEVKVGVQTCDDFRFVRVWWESEVNPTRWFRHLKGDTSSAFYADSECVLNWADDGAELKAFVSGIEDGGHWSRYVRSPDSYFLPGISWALRTAKFSPSCVPAGCIPSVSRYLAFAKGCGSMAVIALWNSVVSDWLCKLRMERHGHPKFIVGVIKAIPFPHLAPSHEERLADLALLAWNAKRDLDTNNSVSHAFKVPSLLAAPGSTLTERAAAWTSRVHIREQTVAAIQTEIDDLAFHLYGLDEADREALANTLATESASEVQGNEGNKRTFSADTAALVADLVDYALGAAFGRWDLRFAIDQRRAPPEPDPFDPLPFCPPGMLQNASGLPATAADVSADYPLRISWSGVLVDDAGHDEDIEERVREILAVVWHEQHEAIAQEASELLGVETLRDYFRMPTGLFANHLKRHSKSRRKAPIYWQLGTTSASYSVWLYYHRFTRDTFYKVLNDYVTPKLQHEERKLVGMVQGAGGSPTASQRKESADQETLVEELRAFRDEVARVAPLWNPDLNDGVIINFAPLWRLVPQHRAWQKECKDCWAKLVAGDYDWAHLAMYLWPERVVPKCAKDHSLAIAHGLEDLLWIDDGGWRPRRPVAGERAALVSRLKKQGQASLQELRRGISAEKVSSPVVGQAYVEALAAFHQRETEGNFWDALERGELDDSELARYAAPEGVVSQATKSADFAAKHGLVKYFWLEQEGTLRCLEDPQQEQIREIGERTSAAVKDALKSLLEAPAPVAGRGGGRRSSIRTKTPRRTASARSDHAGASAPGTSHSEALDAGVMDSVKQAIKESTDGAGKAEVLSATGLTDPQWNAAINALLADGSITKTGAGRGTRYHLTSND